jgi:YidC/Oxa1 family membrane protein insertase
MLNAVYYPLSAVLWCWHWIFGLPLGADSGLAWASAIVLLVVTVRVLLLKPAHTQARTQRRLRQLQPKLAELRRAHAGDPQRLMTEIRGLHREHGVNPWLGIVPMLVQIPVFLGLVHVLRSFHPGIAHYVFDTTRVRSFLGARLFGAPLSDTLTTHPHAGVAAVAAVAVPLVLMSVAMAHGTARVSIARAVLAPTPQTALMNRLLLWFPPIGTVLTAPIWPVGILLYFAAQSARTLAQQWWLSRPGGSESAVTSNNAEHR